MKKTLAILSLLVASSTFAQKGSWYLGGAVGMNSKSTNVKPVLGTETKTKDFSWIVAPEVGTFLADTWQLGLALGIDGQSYRGATVGDTTNAFTLSPTLYCRKFFKITDNFSVFAGLYGNFTTGDEKRTNLGVESKTKVIGFGARLGIGLAYAITDRFTLVGQYGLVGFNSVTKTDEPGNKNISSGFDFGVNTVGAAKLTQGNGSGSVFNIGLYYTIFK